MQIPIQTFGSKNFQVIKYHSAQIWGQTLDNEYIRTLTLPTAEYDLSNDPCWQRDTTTRELVASNQYLYHRGQAAIGSEQVMERK